MNKRQCAKLRSVIKSSKKLIEKIRKDVYDACDVDEPNKYVEQIIEDLDIRLDDVENDLEELIDFDESD